ncbi:hypothetical protein P7C73_g481, partial [Tremellales sp. Uapishka_1]
MPSATYPVKTTVQVEGLGELTGWLNADGTQQFFNIPYGLLSKRWTNSRLRESWPDNKWDGRYLGAASSQPNRPFYPFPMPKRDHLKHKDMEITDEFECLNLHITVPKGCNLTDALPVIVFIHGGGFVFGTANYSILDGRHLANLVSMPLAASADDQSVELGMPTIIVTPNYRFLASHDIGTESPDGNGNFGLIDQKHALEWVHKLMSEVGVDATLPVPERLAAMRAVPTEVLSQATYEVFQGLNLPQFGVVHDDEGIIYDQAYRDHSVEHIIDRIKFHLPASLADEFISHYGIRGDMTYKEKYDAVEAITTDGIFGALPYYLAKANPDRVHVYYWVLFGGLSAILSPEELKLSNAIGSDFIAFAHGRPPYPVWGTSHSARQYGPKSACSVVGIECDTRPIEWYDRIAPHIDAVDRLCTDFMMRRSELVSLEYGPGSQNRVVVTQGKPLAL